jgi:hypothetical protein
VENFLEGKKPTYYGRWREKACVVWSIGGGGRTDSDEYLVEASVCQIDCRV